MIKKIENHPHRHALQLDLQRSQSFTRIKTNDSWSWEHRVVWITRHGTQSTVQGMSIILGRRHRLLHVRGTSCKKEQRRTRNSSSYTMDLLSIPNYYIKKGRPHGHRYGKKPGDREYYIAKFAQEEVQKEVLPGYPRPVYTRREVPQERVWHSVALRKCVARMDDLADEDHTHHLTPEEIRDYRVSWWIRSNKVGSDTMPVRHRSDFKPSIVNLATAQRQRGCSSSESKMVAKLLFVLVELARILVAFFLWASPRRRTQHRLIRETW